MRNHRGTYETVGYTPPILVALGVFIALSLLNPFLLSNKIISQNAFSIDGLGLLIGFSLVVEMININAKVTRKNAMLIISTVLMVSFLSVTYLALDSFLGLWQYFGFAVGFAAASYLSWILVAYNRAKTKKKQN
jgi:predicted MFS family arabinose efflux permease